MGSMSNKKFKKFERLCCQAYNLVRRYSNHFIDLFKIMISAGIPEL